MRAIQRAVLICGSNAALARFCTRVGVKKAPENVRLWLKEGVLPEYGSLIESAVDLAIDTDELAAKRAKKNGGRVRAEQLCPGHRWERNAAGVITAFVTPDPLYKPARAARRRAG